MLSVLSFVLLMLIWEIAGRGGNPFLTSHPSAIFVSLVGQITSGQLPNAFLQSLQPLVLGYALAIVIGVPIGLLLGRYWAAEASFGFYFIGLDATPLVAFLPLFILWFGLHLLVKVVIVFLFSMTPIVINTWMGVKSVPRTLVEVGKSFSGSEAFIVRKIVLPYALPSIVTGLAARHGPRRHRHGDRRIVHGAERPGRLAAQALGGLRHRRHLRAGLRVHGDGHQRGRRAGLDRTAHRAVAQGHQRRQ